MADIKHMSLCTLVIILLIAIATALTVMVSLQERAVRLGSAHAADKFDLVIGAVGSPTQLMLSPVFLQISAMPLGLAFSVIIAKPKTIGDAYKLRQDYRSEKTLAVFPAEVLIGLYANLEDIRSILAIVAFGAQILVGFCI